MTTTYSTFMKTQMAGAGWDWSARTMGLALLAQAAVVGPSTPNALGDVTTGLLGALGWQEVDTAVCPSYVRTTSAVNQSPAAPVPVGNAITVNYASDYAPIPVTPAAAPVFVAAGVWYIVGTVNGVVNPWVMISDDMFGSVLSPGVRISGAPRQFFSYVVRGTTVDITARPIVQSPGTLPWESARMQHVYLLPQRVNWIPNPSFEEVGNFGWRSNGVMNRSSGGVDGVNNHHMHTAGTILESIPVPVSPVFRFSAWLRAAGATKVRLTLNCLDETYAVVGPTTGVGDRALYADWIRYDDLLVPRDDTTAVVPHIEADGAFDCDLCLLESNEGLNYYYDGDVSTGLPGDFSWQGQEARSYSFWYNNRHVTAARLFGAYNDGQVTLPSLVSEWLPTGTAVYTHWDVLSQDDTKHPLKDWASRTMP